jgi:PBSX family phage portal protein
MTINVEEIEDTGLNGRIQMLTEETIAVEPNDPFAKVFDATKISSAQGKIAMEKLLTNATATAGTTMNDPLVNANLYTVLDCAEPSVNMEYLAQLYERSPIHASAVDAKVDNIVGLGYYFKYSRAAEKIREKAASKSDAKKRTVEDNLMDDRLKLEDMVDGFNIGDEFEEVLKKVVTDYLTLGNGFMEVGRTIDGTIGYVGHIPGKSMRIRRPRDGFIQVVGNKYVFFRNFGDRKTKDPLSIQSQPNEIIHFKKYSPTEAFYGMPEVIAATQAIAGIEFAGRFNLDYFEHNGAPRYIIKTKGVKLTPQIHQDLLSFFQTQVKGKHHRAILVPLNGTDKDIEFVPVEVGKQEASWSEYVRQNQEIILARHRVPSNRLGYVDGGGVAASRESDKIFKESVCRPEQSIIQKKINRIFKELTDLFDFKLSEYSLTDEETAAGIYERYLRWGVMVPDEVRTLLDMNPRSDGKGDDPVDTLSTAVAVAELTAGDAYNTYSGVGQQAAEQKAQAQQSRTRDQNRASTAPDSASSAKGRASKGAGRQQA